MHGKKGGGKSPKGPKKSPAKGKKKLARLSASLEDKPPAVEDAMISEEDMNAYLDPMESDPCDGRGLEASLPGLSSGESSDESTVKDAGSASILRQALESPNRPKSTQTVVVNHPRSNVIVPSPTGQSIPSPAKIPNVPSGVIRKLLQEDGSSSSSSGLSRPLGLELPSEETEAIADIIERPPSLVSPAQRPRISPKKRQSPAAPESNIVDLERSPPTPSKMAKIDSFNRFGDPQSPSTETEYLMVAAVPQNEQNLGNIANVLTPMSGVETRNVTFLKPCASQASSVGTDETTRPSDQHSDSRSTQQQSKIYIRAIHEDRFSHMALNVAEKFRLVADVEQQFLAESLQHVILAEALAGKLTRAHKLRADHCVHCAREVKDE